MDDHVVSQWIIM